MTGANRHEAGFYDSDAAFRALIVPFVEEGIAAGEPVVLGYDQRKCDLLRSWIADPEAVQFLGDDALYASPVGAIAAYRELFATHVASGVRRVRVSGELPHSGGRFAGWDRYESAVNVVWSDLPVYSRCLYDATTVPQDVRDVVERTHPFLHDGERAFEPNARYQDPTRFVGFPAPPDPLEETPPALVLVDAMPARARAELLRLANGTVGPDVLADLQLALSEALTNARVHGLPPVTVRLWLGPDRVLIRVHDTGPGPSDPLTGMVPGARTETCAGIGLWLSHQLGVEVDLIAAPDGFTVRLSGGSRRR